MAVLAVKSQQPDGEGRLQPVHPRDQVWLRRLEGEMEMISHDNVGVHSPTEFFARFARDAGKRTAGAGRGEDVVTEVAAVDHMIPGAGKLNAKSSSHRDRSARSRSGSEPALTPISGMPTIRRSLPPRTNNPRTDPVGRSPTPTRSASPRNSASSPPAAARAATSANRRPISRNTPAPVLSAIRSTPARSKTSGRSSV